MSERLDVMLDLETLGCYPALNPTVIQIAAVSFDLSTGEVFESIDIPVSPFFNGEVDEATLHWWQDRSSEAFDRGVVRGVKEGVRPEKACLLFSTWLANEYSTRLYHPSTSVFLWGNGSCIDSPWLMSLYGQQSLPIPVDHRGHRDVRTLVDLAETITGVNARKLIEETDPNSLEHDAIHDCLHQIKYCHKAYTLLKEHRGESDTSE